MTPAPVLVVFAGYTTGKSPLARAGRRVPAVLAG